MGILKAVVGALIAGLGTAATAVTDGHITTAEAIAIATTALVALYGVWQVPNAKAAPPTARHGLAGPAAPTTRTNGGTGSNVRKVAAREDLKQSFGDDRGGTIT